MSRFPALVESYLKECRQDYVGLWQLTSALKREGIVDPTERRQEALAIAQALLESGMQAGQFDRKKWSAWALPSDATVDRIRTEWEALGHEPDIGDIVWFVAPE